MVPLILHTLSLSLSLSLHINMVYLNQQHVNVTSALMTVSDTKTWRVCDCGCIVWLTVLQILLAYYLLTLRKENYDVMLLCLYKCTRGFILVQSFCKDIQICVYI